MTLNLDIPKDIEAGLLAQANASGLSLDEYVRELLRKVAATHPSPVDTELDRRKAVIRMQEFGAKYRLSLDEPITRTLIHEGHRY